MRIKPSFDFFFKVYKMHKSFVNGRPVKKIITT